MTDSQDFVANASNKNVLMTPTSTAWDAWLLPIQSYLVKRLLSDPEIDEILSFLSGTGTARNCPYLLDAERATIQSMIPLERQSTSERVRRSMIDAVPDDRNEP